ncbi:hypothetical protein [Paenibacillus andongensis]|uniref:hypothetical protein n=1 Tax=Paenibacillus andongensis TaxID=2975482 RepID=UPI0021BB2DD3|nr:hypothetical protein [Paenibacillus andongensis]
MKMFKVFKAQFVLAAFLVFNLCVFCAPAAIYAAGTTYYVSPSGNDSNAGTSSSSPWQTISKVNGINFAAGDTILFQGGSSFSGNLQFNSSDGGNSTTRVTVDSYGSGRATINGGTGSAITISGTTGIDIKNINVIGNGRNSGNSGGKGVDFSSCHYCSVTNSDASGFQYAGVRVITSDHIDITYVNAHDNGRAGIISEETSWTQMSDHIYVGNSVANNNPGDPSKTTNETGDGIILMYVTNSTIEYSSASYNGWDQPTGHSNGPEGIFFWSANSCLIQNSLAFKNTTNVGADGGAFDIDGNNCTQQYTYSYSNYGPGFTSYSPTDGGSGNLVYRYNISELDNHAWPSPIWIAVASKPNNAKFNFEFYNNTIYSASSVLNVQDWNAPSNPTDMSGVHFHNNIFQTTGTKILQDDPASTAGTYSGNIWWQSNGSFAGNGYTSFSAWVSGTGKEKINNVLVGKNADPMLVNPGNGEKIISSNYLTAVTAYKLKTGSPALSAGLNLASSEGLNIGTRDYYGNALGSTHNMGAYEGSGIDTATLSSVEDTVTGTSNNQFQYSGSWTTGTSGDHYSSSANNYFQIPFNGTEIKWVGSADTNQGQAAVSIDNGPETIVDTYLSNRTTGVTLYHSGVLSSGQHTLKVRVTGTKSSASTNYYVYRKYRRGP